MEHLLKLLTTYLAVAVEACAALIIAFAAIEATIKSLKLFFWHRNFTEELKEDIRLRLGGWLAVALEFELASDILLTAITPTWNEIGKLAAIIVLRTVLNFFLQQELQKAATRKRYLPK